MLYKNIRSLSVAIFTTISCLSGINAQAQNAEDSAFKPSGTLYGLAYGDFAVKVKGDTLNRGRTNQYTGYKENQSLFQFRRIYLGYKYNLTKTFTAELLLAAEDNQTTSSLPVNTTSGDLVANNKLAMFVKLANIQWKDIFKGSTLSIGQVYTPSAVQSSEVLWDYRCIERTVSDLRRTPTYDMGVKLRGRIIDGPKNELGYTAMIANGNAAKPENDPFKMFYGDVYAKLFNGKLVLDLYADYTKLNWTPYWHHDRNTVKGIIAYTVPKFTIGVEAFLTTLMNDNIAHVVGKTNDTITTVAVAVSAFAHGSLYKDKLGFFIRYDNYDPSMKNNNAKFDSYAPITTNYDPNTREQFFTAGIDWSPISKIHIMPNVWITEYNNAGPLKNYDGTDVVLRLSLYYIYGK